ncbi:FAD-dependent monooxygenase [Haloarcula sp. GH36]|uniref:FAD-dependent monooxygenase n=1 Tax=Haloarcula montana TaxID=3111776 RepID=UPI002D77A4FD|nr:hypothetical protein [Haloarcula sp. GH36]
MTPGDRDDRIADITTSEAAIPTGVNANQGESNQNWLLEVNTDRYHRDRQVLVVGDTIVGLTLTLALHQSGYDPLLVRDPGRPVKSQATFLSPSACRVLRSLGVGPLLSEQGVPVESISVERSSSTTKSATILSASTDSDATEAMVIDTRKLRNALDARLPDRQRSTSRSIAMLSTHDSGLQVEFEDGITEWFDVLTDTSLSGVARRLAFGEILEPETLVQYETSVETARVESTRIQDIWRPNALVQLIPSSVRSSTIVRLTTPRTALPSNPDGSVIATIINESSADIEIDHQSVKDFEWEATTVRQPVHCDDGTRKRWGSGRLSFCGAAVSPTAPATGFATWFGIESSLALLSELNRTEQSVSDAVDTYAAQRRQRLGALRRTTRAVREDHAYSLPDSVPASLDTLGELRQLTLGSFLDSRLWSVQYDWFREF